MDSNLLLTPQEAADRLRVTKKHLLALCLNGLIPSLKLGLAKNSPIRIPAAALDTFLKAATRGHHGDH